MIERAENNKELAKRVLREDVLKDIEAELTSAEAMLAIHDPARAAIHTAIMRVRSKYAIEALG